MSCRNPDHVSPEVTKMQALLSQDAMGDVYKQEQTKSHLVGYLGQRVLQKCHSAKSKSLRQHEIGNARNGHKRPETAASETRSIYAYPGVVLLVLLAILRNCIELRTIVRAGPHGSTQSGYTAGTHPSYASQTEHLPGLTSSSSHSAKHRNIRRRKPGRDDDDRTSQPRSKVLPDDLAILPPFACPFYLRDKEGHPHCLHYKLKRISDVRQHIGRIHVQPANCPHCGTVFQNDPVYAHRDAHIRDCQDHGDVAPPPGATSEQLNAMSSDAKDRKKRPTEVERWYAIWDILFPGIERPPSPYIDASWEYDHRGSRARISHFRQHGGLQQFLLSVGVNEWMAYAFAADQSSLPNLLLNYLEAWNPPAIVRDDYSHNVQSVHTNTIAEAQWSSGSESYLLHIPRSNTVSHPDFPDLPPQPSQAESSHVDWTLLNQDADYDTVAEHEEFDYENPRW